jgi:hypothetical protein
MIKDIIPLYMRYIEYGSMYTQEYIIGVLYIYINVDLLPPVVATHL